MTYTGLNMLVCSENVLDHESCVDLRGKSVFRLSSDVSCVVL